MMWMTTTTLLFALSLLLGSSDCDAQFDGRYVVRRSTSADGPKSIDASVANDLSLPLMRLHELMYPRPKLEQSITHPWCVRVPSDANCSLYYRVCYRNDTHVYHSKPMAKCIDWFRLGSYASLPIYTIQYGNVFVVMSDLEIPADDVPLALYGNDYGDSRQRQKWFDLSACLIHDDDDYRHKTRCNKTTQSDWLQIVERSNTRYLDRRPYTMKAIHRTMRLLREINKRNLRITGGPIYLRVCDTVNPSGEPRCCPLRTLRVHVTEHECASGTWYDWRRGLCLSTDEFNAVIDFDFDMKTDVDRARSAAADETEFHSDDHGSCRAMCYDGRFEDFQSGVMCAHNKYRCDKLNYTTTVENNKSMRAHCVGRYATHVSLCGKYGRYDIVLRRCVPLLDVVSIGAPDAWTEELPWLG